MPKQKPRTWRAGAQRCAHRSDMVVVVSGVFVPRYHAPMNTEKIQLLDSQVHDLGGFSVRRVIPHRLARHIGPFVFFDHIGPADFPAGKGIDVRPHPHIGLATVTYLFNGAIRHRDSLDNDQTIRPGDVNWMTAGRGIVHSERTPDAERESGQHMHGIQIWVALPRHAEETEPSFHHHAVDSLPQFDIEGVSLRLIVGDAPGYRSPVRTFSPMFYLAGEFKAGTSFALPAEYEQRAVYATDARLNVGGIEVAPGQLALLPPGNPVEISAADETRVLMLGGDPLDGERHVWWNFVSSSPERIEQAKRDWLEGRFDSVPGDDEFIPLPSDR